MSLLRLPFVRSCAGAAAAVQGWKPAGVRVMGMPGKLFGRPLVMAALIVGLAACSRDAMTFNGVTFDPPDPAPALTLSRADGSMFELKAQRGSVVLLFFGYTNCPDICPTTLSDWKKVKQQLGSDASRVKFVFISVDPARDTPALTQKYASAFDPDFIGLSGDSAQVAAAESLFHVQSVREDIQSANGYAVSHASQTFVVDSRNRMRLLLAPGMPPDKIAADVKVLLRNG